MLAPSSLVGIERIERNRKLLGWVSLLVGVAMVIGSFMTPNQVRPFVIAGCGLAFLGVTYLIAAGETGSDADVRRWIARFMCGICIVVTVIAIVLDSTTVS